MTTEYQQVREFMRAFRQRVPEAVTMPEIVDREMRDRLIREECEELYNANTPVEKLDAVIDLLYVVLGAGVDCGFTPEQVAAGFSEVHRSNMSKMWDEFDLQFLSDESGIATYNRNPVTVETAPNSDRSIVRHNSGKIVKSPSYSPANLLPILEEAKGALSNPAIDR